MGELAAIGAIALLFAAFALLHRRVEPRGPADSNEGASKHDGCESCSHHSDCLETSNHVR